MGFLDNIGKSLSQGVDRAKFEAEKLQRTQRIKGELSDLQRQVETNLRQLGERALELHRSGQIQAPEIGSLAQMLDQLMDQQNAKQAELTAAQNDSFEAQPPPQPQAYQQPGYQQGYQQPPQQAASGTISCPSCNISLPANAAFCANCGARI
jgi:hypothetical protein